MTTSPAANDASKAIAPQAICTDVTPARRPLTAEQLERFVYLAGSPRGGTTVIMRAFYLSDRVFACPSMTKFTQQVWRNRDKVDERLLRQLFNLPKFYRERQILKALDPAERVRVRGLIHNAFATRNLGRMYQLYPLLYSLDVACTKEPERALCWADKANDIYGLLDIPRFLPKAKFIFIIRDPRATIASMTGQIARSREEAGLPGERLNALIAGCFYWRNMMQTFLRFSRRYPDRTLFIRYEDFVQNPERSINRLLDFAVGEAMPEETLRVGLSQFKHKKKHDRGADGRGIDVRPLERWHRMLTDDEIEVTTALTWRTGRKLGYAIDPSRGRFLALSAPLRFKGWRSRAASSAKLGYLALMEWVTPWRERPAVSLATNSQGDNA